ncbi:MAG: 2-oxo acid dehydrogenase subunit E2, partial [Microlunatus sp.]|nr:2-oxo acid dehydrogenase subunit E2 [Microlunatus sp.]
GLTVPVVHDAHRLTMRSLDAEIRRMSAAALEGRASPSDLSGGTFTLNNYGSFGIDGSAAIVNFPEAAILGVGRTLERPWVVDSEIVARMITQLSLVFDHRVTDGGTAAGFLRFVADCIERPTAALTEV